MAVDEAREQMLVIARQLFELTAERRNQLDPSQPTRVQAQVLYRVREKGSLTMSEIARVLRVTPATATQLVKSMVKKDWLSRHIDESDLRSHSIRLTEAGAAALKCAEKQHREAIDRVLQALTPEERAMFVTLARRIAEIVLNDKTGAASAAAHS